MNEVNVETFTFMQKGFGATLFSIALKSDKCGFFTSGNKHVDSQRLTFWIIQMTDTCHLINRDNLSMVRPENSNNRQARFNVLET